jgi:hypothetical protein
MNKAHKDIKRSIAEAFSFIAEEEERIAKFFADRSDSSDTLEEQHFSEENDLLDSQDGYYSGSGCQEI